MEQPVIVCGLGRVGVRVLEYLHTAGIPVVVVDNECRPNDICLSGATLIPGDFRDRAVLEKAGVRNARGILILTSNDLINVSTTLMIRAMGVQARIVVRVFNTVLIPRLGKVVPNVFALSTSALTAPLLALTALTGDTLGAFTLGDVQRQVANVTLTAASPFIGRTVGSLAARYEALVVAHGRAQGELHFLLDVDTEAILGVDDRLVVCGEPHQLAPLLNPTNDNIPPARWLAWLRRQGKMVWQTLREVDLGVQICTAVLVVVVAASTLVYHFGIYDQRRTLSDSLYRTISVMATGADMSERGVSLGQWQKVFVSGLRIFGAAIVAAFTALVTNFLIRAHLGGVLEIRRIPDAGHVVVCGLGNLGFRVTEELRRAGEQVVAIEQSRESRFLAAAHRLGVPVIIGDAAMQELLRQANAPRARAVVASVNNDLANLEIALLVRELNPHQRVIVRLSQTDLAQALREAANIRYALSISALAAPAFVAALFGDRVHSLFLVGTHQLAVIEVVVQPNDPFLAAQTVRTLALDYGLLLVDVARCNRTIRSDSPDGHLQAGDRLIAIASLPDLDRLLRREQPPAKYTVEVKECPPTTRPALAGLFQERNGITAEEAGKTVGCLPALLGAGLTRSQAEDLLLLTRKHGARGELKRQGSKPTG